MVFVSHSKVNFHVLPLKKPSKYFSFCDTVFSSWGGSGRICYLPYCLFQKEKKEKRKEKKALLHAGPSPGFGGPGATWKMGPKFF
jgi:hypothetical protein